MISCGILRSSWSRSRGIHCLLAPSWSSGYLSFYVPFNRIKRLIDKKNISTRRLSSYVHRSSWVWRERERGIFFSCWQLARELCPEGSYGKKGLNGRYSSCHGIPFLCCEEKSIHPMDGHDMSPSMHSHSKKYAVSHQSMRQNQNCIFPTQNK